jgi:hypothetical protein
MGKVCENYIATPLWLEPATKKVHLNAAVFITSSEPVTVGRCKPEISTLIF